MFDLHCDTITKIGKGEGLGSNLRDVSFEKLARYGRAGQLFAVFNPGAYSINDILGFIDLVKAEADKSPVAKFCTEAEDFKACDGGVCAYVSVEGLGNTRDLKPEHLDSLYKAGVRIMSLTWNDDNFLCGGIGSNTSGFTNLGRRFVDKMIELGMILDVSHISDPGFFEAAEYKDLKIIATHSNSRAVCPESRNLTDEQFGIIINRGSVTGLNLYPLFINGTRSAGVHELIGHIEHFCSLGGEKNISLGGDFDGITYKMSDIDSCEKLDILFGELAKLNYTEEQIRGIAYKNFINFFEGI